MLSIPSPIILFVYSLAVLDAVFALQTTHRYFWVESPVPTGCIQLVLLDIFFTMYTESSKFHACIANCWLSNMEPVIQGKGRITSLFEHYVAGKAFGAPNRV